MRTVQIGQSQAKAAESTQCDCLAGPTAMPIIMPVFPARGSPSIVPPRRLNRDSPDDSRTGVNTRVFPAFLQHRSEVRTPSVWDDLWRHTQRCWKEQRSITSSEARKKDSLWGGYRHLGQSERIKSFCGACRRRNSVGLTRVCGTRRFGWVWNFQLGTGPVAIRSRPRQVRNERLPAIFSA